MSWRTLLMGLTGVCLPLPLLVLLWGALRPASPETVLGSRQLSPALDTETRTALSTYRRRCNAHLPCEPPLGCLWDTRLLAAYCTDSRCTSDLQCPDGQRCRAIATEGDGPLVRLCAAVGVRQEGERCLALADDQDSACVAELICGGRPGRCARPCRRETSSACPDGFSCVDTLPEPVCLPTCEARGCPDGQQCIREESGASVCAHVYGANCQQTPCSGGRKCEVEQASSRPGKLWLECVERCGDDFPSCPEGMTCNGWRCKPACDPHVPGACAEGYRCKQFGPDEPYMCQPDW